jgi:hypothetical protein
MRQGPQVLRSSLQYTILAFSRWEGLRRRLSRRTFEDREHLSYN